MIYDHAEATAQLKALRHELIRASASVPGLDIDTIMARGSERDVLRSGETTSEGTRRSVADIVQANSGRAQEALRSLEEYAKLITPGLSERYKSVRFLIYDCEKLLMAMVMRSEATDHDHIAHGLIVPASSLHSNDITSLCRDYRIGMIVIDPENTSDRDFPDILCDAIQTFHEHSIKVLVRGRSDLAVAVSADGVMIESTHIDPHYCRQIIGVKGIIASPTRKPIESNDSDAIDVLLAFSRNDLPPNDNTDTHRAKPLVYVAAPHNFDETFPPPVCDGVWIAVKDSLSSSIMKLCKTLKW